MLGDCGTRHLILRKGRVRGLLKLKTGIMTFKDLLAQYAFAEIRQPFMRLWQTNEPKLAARLDLDKWEKIYQKVQALEPIPSDYYIGIVSRWERCSPMIDMNCSVYAKSDGWRDGPVACHPSWRKIVGMEVTLLEDDIELTPQELAAGLFWEITYFGGTEEIARRNIENRFHAGSK